MFKTTYKHEVHKKKYERSDVFEDPGSPEDDAEAAQRGHAGARATLPAWESLQELNSRFARYINRARVLEQRNAVFRAQLETLQRMEEAAGLEEAFHEQISVNRQRMRELQAERAKLERELKDAERMLDEFNSRYRNECEYQEQLRGTLEQLNKEADSALLRNLEYQIESQFLQDDISSTRDRHKKVKRIRWPANDRGQLGRRPHHTQFTVTGLISTPDVSCCDYISLTSFFRRLNSAIIGTPISLFTTNYRYTPPSTTSSRGKDITQAIQDITNVKPRQKNLAKKVTKKKELTPKDVIDSGQEERGAGEEDRRGAEDVEGEVKREDHSPLFKEVAREDVPDGAQISKAFDTLCNIVRDRMRKYKKPEPLPDFYTKGRYVLVTGESSYLDPCFYTSTPSAGHVIVTICDDRIPPYEPYGRRSPSPTPSPAPPGPAPIPLTPPTPSDNGKEDDGHRKEDGDDRKEDDHWRNRDSDKDKDPISPTPPVGPVPALDPSQPSAHGGKKEHGGDSGGRRREPSPRSNSHQPESMSYEKVEVVESVEKLSPDNKVKGYEETAVVVETMIEKTSKKRSMETGPRKKKSSCSLPSAAGALREHNWPCSLWVGTVDFTLSPHHS
uniref:Filensin n=1 Tax=Astyanax mexicanus TaxID=7994 RepID=A0A8B9H3P7_ASTMX